ncbi:hypothetical protein [Streptomyces sp. NPDC055793]
MSELPRQLAARVDRSLARDIRALRLAGLSYSQMVKYGVALLADVYRGAWQYQQAPVFKTPILKSYIYAPYDPTHQGPPWIEPKETDREDPAEVPAPSDRQPDDAGTAVHPGLELAGLSLRVDPAAEDGELHRAAELADATLR